MTKNITSPATAAERAMNRYKEQYGVIVICRNEEDQAEIYNRLKQLNRTVKVVTT
ncbi:MAG: hypothetical protein PHI85_03875 [Victivallaceae bacterium]|nr:hypothetical protein [Victivallaceae bacterium]